MGIENGLPAGFSPDAYDAIIVGAGYAGATCARRLAESCGFKVCVLERRDHIAGNAYDYTDEAGVLVHKYGPHIYHTVNDRVNEFLSRFTEWTDYQHKVLANIHGTLMPVPFNHRSLKLAFGEEKGEKLYQKLVATFGENKKVPIMELREKNDPELVEVADYVFENVFLHYTMKQWGQTPDQIDPSITGRVPVFVGDDDRYFPQAPYQGIVPLEAETLSAALEEYFRRSEQIETVIRVAADGLSAGGVMLQKLPETGGKLPEDYDPEGWSRLKMFADTVKSRELLTLEPAEVNRRLFWEESPLVTGEEKPAFVCSCSEERFREILRSVGREEAESILKDEGKITLTCRFCGRSMTFDRLDVEALFAGADGKAEA